MTDRLRDDQLDHDIRSFLAWRAEDIAGAPTATEVAMRIKAPSGPRGLVPGISAQLAWLLIAALLAVALIGAAVVGSNLLRDERALVVVDPTPTVAPTASVAPTATVFYEAVVLRLEVSNGSHEVIVVGVSRDGDEREIARLPGAWLTYNIRLDPPYLAPMGAVSPGGLLAIPSSDDGWNMHWEIFDLHRPQADPIVIPGINQHVEQLQQTPYYTVEMQPSVFWGPGERLAIPLRDENGGWDVSFVDARTGAATPVAVPDVMQIRPYWASDGSGVLVDSGLEGSAGGVEGVFLDSTQFDPDASRVLHPDGTITEQAAAVAAEPSCRTRYESGATITVSDGQVVLSNPDGSREELASPGAVQYACLAPDDSAIALRVSVHEGTATPSRPLAGLIVPGSGARFEIEGSFAGFLEVAP